MPENKDLTNESFLLVRFEKPHSTSLIDFKNNNVDEFQMLQIAQLLELTAKKIMMDGLSTPVQEVAPPKILTPNG